LRYPRGKAVPFILTKPPLCELNMISYMLNMISYFRMV
jgi:hypothetical protein